MFFGINDLNLLNALGAFNRENALPERVVHARGSGFRGVFTLTNDMSKYTKASLFNGVG